MFLLMQLDVIVTLIIEAIVLQEFFLFVGSLCQCKKGFELLNDTYSCEDIDECRQTPPPCEQHCFNLKGSYRCGCTHGYKLRPDNHTCRADGMQFAFSIIRGVFRNLPNI